MVRQKRYNYLNVERGGRNNRNHVKQLQSVLNKLGASLAVDGDYGGLTASAVSKYQDNGNVVTMQDFEKIAALLPPQHLMAVDGLTVHPCYLSQGEYKDKSSRYPYVGACNHHTVSNHNPHNVVFYWDGDNRGRVATTFVVGGKALDGSDDYDGLVLQCMSDEQFGFHIAMTREGFSSSGSEVFNQSYIGIEFCSYAVLDKVGERFYYNYKRHGERYEVPRDQVAILSEGFRSDDYLYWHEYSDAQMDAFVKLNLALMDKYGWKPEQQPKDWFELSWKAIMRKERVFATHTNFEKGKFDMAPTPKLLNAINQLYKKAR
jgi:hypothetical protein